MRSPCDQCDPVCHMLHFLLVLSLSRGLLRSFYLYRNSAEDLIHFIGLPGQRNIDLSQKVPVLFRLLRVCPLISGDIICHDHEKAGLLPDLFDSGKDPLFCMFRRILHISPVHLIRRQV